MGRPQKDPALHELQGTRSRANAEAESVAPGRPKFPKDLSKEARPVFKNLVRLLEKRRHITEGDVYLCRVFALIYVRHAKAMAKLEAEGEIRNYVRLDSNGQPHDQEKPNLWLKVAETAEKNMVAILDRLGLTAMNRAKVKPTGEPKDKPLDPLEEFMAQRNNRAAAAPDDDDDVEDLLQ